MPEEKSHLSAMSLEQLAEGILRGAEADAARAHLASCSRCTAELEGYGQLFRMLSQLPRFAPSPVFAGAVMARVQITPRESRLAIWLRRLVPRSRGGWILAATAVLAPAAPVIALLAWLLFNPLVTPAAIWGWSRIRLEAGAQTALAWVIERFEATAQNALALVYSLVEAVPNDALGGAAIVMAVAIPLSAWALVRLTRTPSGKITYANQ